MNGTRFTHRSLGFVLAMIPCLGGCLGARPDFDELISEGRKELAEDRHAEALAMFEMAAEVDPERPEPSFLLGRCYLAMARREFVMNDLPGALRNCDRSIASFHKAIAAFPGYDEAIKGEAEALRLRSRHQAALDIARWVATQSGYRAKKLILEAHEYANAGDLDNAQLSFKKATSVEPDNARAHAELGLFYFRLGNDAEAVKCLSRAYELNPRVPGVLQALLDLGAVPDHPARS
ncbi:MAG: tetratricopeptide repeat protein [Phycisphaerae bacterium]